ncbi:MAG: DUF4350 domain-containing protein [Alteripontixanthobacter sp.]
MASIPASTATAGDGGNAAPFDPKVVLGLLLFGTLAFLATLYFIGSGNTGSRENGQAHAVSNGFNGYAGLAALLDRQGYEVDVSRSPGRYDTYGLLVLTPPPFTDAEELAEIIEDRRFTGPTLVILPKWQAFPVPDNVDVEHEDGWVIGEQIGEPPFAARLDEPFAMSLKTGLLRQRQDHWSGLGMTGNLPDRRKVMAFDEAMLNPLVSDADGDMLVGYLDDGGHYPVLDEAAGIPTYDIDQSNHNIDKWNVTFVAEPDLMNNYGMADAQRAALALALIGAVQEGEDLPVIFDVTLNGLGGTQNLLTLAFTPPFLAATLCLILALIVVGWRGFKRFGPPVAAMREIAFGKTRLVANGAGLIQRSGRLHLLTDRYGQMIAARIASKLGLRHSDPEHIDAALARRAPDMEPFSLAANRLERARRPAEILRAAHGLREIEQQLERKPR